MIYRMLKTIGFSYAMDNSPKSVKEVARYFTSDVMQNGLGEVYSRLYL